MKTNDFCKKCQLDKFEKLVMRFPVEKREKALKEFRDITEFHSDGKSSPWLAKKAKEIAFKEFGIVDEYEEEKRHFNQLILGIEDQIRKDIDSSENPLKKALSYAMIGNYIDFDAVKDVSEDKLFELLHEERFSVIDEKTYSLFTEDLNKGKNLVYLTDNCGEIVFDKLLIETIKKNYPSIKVTAILRGEPIVNDATMHDASEVGLNKVCQCISNGSDCASTIMDEIGEEAREVIRNSDLVISKGQGNLEGFLGSGFNTYYLFLIKCDLFVTRFNKERFTPMFINEKDMANEK